MMMPLSLIVVQASCLLLAVEAAPKQPKSISREESARHYFLGMAKMLRGNHLFAAWEMTRSIEHDPTNARAWVERGNLFLAYDQMEQALADYSRALENDPKHLIARLRRGCVLVQLEQFRDAIMDLDCVLEREPRDSIALKYRAAALASNRLYEPAVEDCTTILQLEPDDTSTLHNRGIAYFHNQQFEKARVDFDRYIELTSDDYTGYLRRGQIVTELNDHAAAIRDFTKVIEFVPDSAPVYRLRSNACLAAGKYAEALADLEKATSLEPTAQSYKDLARFLLDCPDPKIRDRPRAVELAEKASVLARLAVTNPAQSEDPSYDQLRASALASCGEFEKAIAILDRLAAIHSEEGDQRRIREQLDVVKRVAAIRGLRPEKPGVIQAKAQLPPIPVAQLPASGEPVKSAPVELPPISIPVIPPTPEREK